MTLIKDQVLGPQPKTIDFPDWTNARLSFDMIATGWMHQQERPLIGDVVAVMESDGMGMGIRSQSNHIIVNPYADQKPPKEEIPAVALENGERLFVCYLRKYKPRMWIYIR